MFWNSRAFYVWKWLLEDVGNDPREDYCKYAHVYGNLISFIKTLGLEKARFYVKLINERLIVQEKG